jgi:hypothetical protein
MRKYTTIGTVGLGLVLALPLIPNTALSDAKAKEKGTIVVQNKGLEPLSAVFLIGIADGRSLCLGGLKPGEVKVYTISRDEEAQIPRGDFYWGERGGMSMNLSAGGPGDMDITIYPSHVSVSPAKRSTPEEMRRNEQAEAEWLEKMGKETRP